jgi:hypothetical protein
LLKMRNNSNRAANSKYKSGLLSWKKTGAAKRPPLSELT